VKTRILITGLNGVVGWSIFSEARHVHDVVGTYRKRHPAFLGKLFHRINLSDAEEVKAFVVKARPEYVIHAWAMCDLDVCETAPHVARAVNVEGTRKLIQAVQQLPNLKKLVYISTDHVFDGESAPYQEGDEPVPKHVYGRTKVEAEMLVKDTGFPHLIVRPGLVLGQSAQGNVGPRDFLLARLRAGKPITYFTDEWRTPIGSEELARRVLELTLSKTTGVVHVAGKEIINRYDLAKRIAREANVSSDQIIAKKREEDAWAHIRPRNLSIETSVQAD
jgi:dTDP-4-dehydrorhamnose reductase